MEIHRREFSSNWKCYYIKRGNENDEFIEEILRKNPLNLRHLPSADVGNGFLKNYFRQFCWVFTVTNRLSTSETCQQHELSPSPTKTSVVKIDVTGMIKSLVCFNQISIKMISYENFWFILWFIWTDSKNFKNPCYTGGYSS